MTTLTPTERAERFNSLDIHDDTVQGVLLLPGTKRSERMKLQVTLFRHWENKHRLLTFHDCENIELNLDAMVLAGNAPSNTCGALASSDEERIVKLMKAQRRSWIVTYQRSIDPMPAKLALASKCVLFRVRMFGGTLAVVARSFTMRRASNNDTTTLERRHE
jgi:hypothetical protein